MKNANTTAVTVNTHWQNKKQKTKNSRDVAEQALPPEHSDTLIDPSDENGEDFEDDASAWKYETPMPPSEATQVAD